MGWACIQTYGGQEAKAILNLRRQGFEAFCPSFVRPADSRKAAPLSHPLFPGYAFVLIDPGITHWGPINSTLGVIRLLTNNSRTAPVVLFVADSLIESLTALRVLEDSGLRPDAVVRVKRLGSPFYDLVGTVVGMTNSQRVQVLMSLFNRDTVVEFDATGDLEVVP